MIGSISIGLSLFFLASLFAQRPGLAYLGAISHLFTMIWLLGVGYAIVKHRLMIISPAEAAYSIFTTMADGVLLLDRDGRIVNANPASCEILRLRESDLLTHRVDEAIPGAFTADSLKIESGGIIHDREALYSNNAGVVVYLSFSASTLMDRSGNFGGTVIVFRDITERKHTEERFLHMATHDALTNLPNRVLLNDRLRIAISRAERHEYIIAVLLVDLDRFKDVNDRYGHDAGDRVLNEVARRLSGSVREYDTVCRFGGDEFVVVLSDMKARQDCDIVIKRIRAAFSTAIKFDSFELLQTLSIGASLYPLHADNVEDLFKFADRALYQVKAKGRNDLQFYEGEEDASTRRTKTIEQDLRTALTAGDLELYYQPVYDISSLRMIAIESLIRWHHAQLGLVSPMEFIPYAERCGLIVPLGEWVVKQACRQSAAWQAGGREIPITVNLSARQFQDPDLCEKIKQALEDTRLRLG
jgi:diguanylate cyclase (GGDEF)-like protein/PAS domain S-box-containing protein